MSETYKINGHIYRAYLTRFFCYGVEISQAVFYAAISLLHSKSQHY